MGSSVGLYDCQGCMFYIVVILYDCPYEIVSMFMFVLCMICSQIVLLSDCMQDYMCIIVSSA